ncbi:MAG: Gfo/Idh/MocA family oxidoreductase [Chitinophagaceae bacterium]
MSSNSHPIRTGLCAFGMSGKVFHAPFLHCMAEFELAAVVERHDRGAKGIYPAIHSFKSVEEMLSDNSIELIVVNTPNITHFEYVKMALLANKDVIVEKPFAATLEQSKELVALAKKQKHFLCVYQNRRWESDFLTVKEVIEKKLLGDLIEAEFHYDRYRLELNSKKPHKEKPDIGVGTIYDLGPHLVDEAIVLFGKPDAVFAIIQSHRPNSLIDDYFEIKLLYRNFTCTLKSSLLVREPQAGYILHGVKGSFIKSMADNQEANLQNGVSPCISRWGEEPEDDWGILHTEINGLKVRKKYPSVPGNYATFYKKVYNSLAKNDKPPVALEDSLLNMQIIEAACKSNLKKKIVKL